ncbi:hypothetical protein QE418_000587 [Microbacterium testaceum]|uniref:hypothetical protein n=1 Tax=Microbacterium TaxID=33882 RepID=UPI002783663F|nr:MULTISPECIES: hypothetical protein [Microbacterium]MDQ1111139.1 hypothetical protein [Microbacterium testaceum]MDR6098322.1 hypothetical protein [Microbacterium sp. SORGH_AS_0454]
MLTPSLPSEAASGVPVGAWRRLDAGLVARAANGTPRTGILPWTLDDLVTGTSDLAMTYRIGPFVAVTARGAGVERVANDASETIGTDPAPQANSRIDVIWVRATFILDGDTTPSVLFGVTKGVANANPQKPTIPAGALELATAVVTSSDLATQTCVTTQTARYTATAGGTVLLRNQAEMNAWTPADGATAYRLDTGLLMARRGGAWKLAASVTRATALLDSDANGFITIPHGLGVTPDAVSVSERNHPSTDTNTLAFRAVVWNDPDETAFKVRLINTSTPNAYPSSPQQFRLTWTAQ